MSTPAPMTPTPLPLLDKMVEVVEGKTMVILTKPKEGPDEPRSPFGRALLKDFFFDKNFVNLNHGSFGTYPRSVHAVLRSYQDAAEARPDPFIRYEYPKHLDESRAAMARFLHVPIETVVFLQNATTGVNTVLRNLTFEPGDRVLYFQTIYGACENTVQYITETTPAEAVKVEYTYPVEDDWLVEEMKRKVKKIERQGGKVKVAIFDAVVSMPGVRMPFEKLAKACKELGVLSCVDGAHGVGHVELDLGELDPDFFISNCHKWLYVPRGCAVFYVPVRNQHLIRSTLPTSHGFIPLLRPEHNPPNNPLPPSNKASYITNFEFVGTIDNSPYLCIPAALGYRASLGGESAILRYTHTLAREGGRKVAEILATEVMENATGTLGGCCFSNVRLPLKLEDAESMAKEMGVEERGRSLGLKILNWMLEKSMEEYGTFLALIFYGGAWWVRLSSQVYLDMEDFAFAGRTLKELSERAMRGEFAKG